jgi:hypothetical protein
MTTEEKMAFIQETLVKATERYVGQPTTKESIEAAMSGALGMPVRLSDYNPETQAYETVEVCLPYPVQYIELDFELGGEDEDAEADASGAGSDDS